MPETTCLFENQTAVFLKCAEIDCGFKTSESPALRGFVGGPHAKATAALYLVLLSNGQIRGETLRNRAWPGGKHPSPKARFSIVGAGFTGPFHTSPQTPQRSFQGAAAGTHATPAPNRAHSGSHGETRGKTRSRPSRGGSAGLRCCAWEAFTPAFPRPSFRSSPTGSAFLPVSSPCCREPYALSCSQCTGMFQTDPIHYPVFPCR